MKNRDQIKLELIYENMHGDKWAETSWQDSTKDGKTIKVTIDDLFKFSKNIPVEELSVGDLEYLALHKTKTDPETQANIQKANLDYPILVLDKSKDKKPSQVKSSVLIQHPGLVSILDGHHRLQKAIVNELPTIKAKVLHLADMPEDWQWLFR